MDVQFQIFLRGTKQLHFPNKRIIKHPGGIEKTKHINQFVPLITVLIP